MWLLIAFALLILADAPAQAAAPPPEQTSGPAGEQQDAGKRRLVLVERLPDRGR